jgi:hypothetical protein
MLLGPPVGTLLSVRAPLELIEGCFFKTHATIANITDEDIIRCFQNSLFSKNMYHDFRRNRPTTAVELRDMMVRWAD